MHVIKVKYGSVILTLGLMLATTGHAFDLGNIMDPTRWAGGRDDYYDDYPGGYGYGYPGGYGYGYPGDSMPGYGGLPGYGYGAFPDYHYGGIPGYGGLPGLGTDTRYDYGGDPGGYGYPAAPGHIPGTTESPEAAEIQRLKERIKKLEEASNQAPPVWNDQPTYPANSSPWGTQPGAPAASTPWDSQPGYPATTAPWGTQPGVQPR